MLLGAILCAPGCSEIEGLRPLTDLRVRLLRSQPVPSPPLPRVAVRPARAFVLSGAVFEAAGDSWWATCHPDGSTTEGREITWSARDATLEHGEHPGRVLVLPTGPAPWVEAALSLRGRTLATCAGDLPSDAGMPRVAVVGDRLLVDAPPGSELEWSTDPPASLGPGTYEAPAATVGVRTRTPGAVAPWTWVSPGGLPPMDRSRRVPLRSTGCDDPEFPRRIGDRHYGCSGRGGILDQVARAGRSKPHALPPGARVEASRSAPAGTGFVWAHEEAGRWDGEVEVRPLHGGVVRGRPAADGSRSVVARPDRFEILQRGTSRRTQVAAEPLDGTAVVAIHGDHVAVVEGTRSESRLRIRRLDVHTDAIVARGADFRRPRIAGSAVLYFSGPSPRRLPLEGGVARSYPVEVAAHGEEALLDDFWLVSVRSEGDGGDLYAIHVPTGIGDLWHRAEGAQRVRGAGAGAVSWAVGGADSPLLWTSAPASVRLFEEDGPSAAHPVGERRRGGHGGRHLHLPTDANHTISIEHPTMGSVVEVFRGSGAGTLTLLRGTRRSVRALHERPEGPGWEIVGTVEGGLDLEGEPLRLEFRGGRQGLDVDAVRLRARDGGA